MGQLTQRRQTPDMTTYLGKGKVDEQATRQLDRRRRRAVRQRSLARPDAQPRRGTGVKVLDRSELILDIFAGQAETYQARLAVELARLQYSLPRLKQMWNHLSRLKMSIGMRGLAKAVGSDRRLVEKKISGCTGELKAIEQRGTRSRRSQRADDRFAHQLHQRQQEHAPQPATGSDVLAENRLFATLDTRTRRWQLPGWGPVLLSDTVGFIRDLPHHLIASFKATLEEARNADLLMHVADASNPAALEQITVVYQVLEELGIKAKDTLLVDFAQCDATDRQATGAIRTAIHGCPSARTGNRQALGPSASQMLSHNFLDIDVKPA